MELQLEENKLENMELVADLREDYLFTLAALKNHKVHVKMQKNTSLSGIFKIMHPNGRRVILTDVHIPVGNMQNSAILRTSDIVSMTFENEKK